MANQYIQNSDNKKRSQAFAAALILHALLLLLFFLIVFRTPIPPFPDGGSPGFEINFGTSTAGMGSVEANDRGDVQADKQDKQPQEKQEVLLTKDNEVVTNDAEESINLSKKDKAKKNTAPVENAKKKEEKISEELAKAMKGWDKSKQSGGHGSSETPGNEGGPNGSFSGNGSGGGGTGTGKGPGSSFGYSLKNRKIVKDPSITDDFQEEGIVVVAITVDGSGKVTQAEVQLKGSTTTNSVLQAKARQFARTTIFNQSAEDDAPLQYGTMTFHFKRPGK